MGQGNGGEDEDAALASLVAGTALLAAGAPVRCETGSGEQIGQEEVPTQEKRLRKAIADSAPPRRARLQVRSASTTRCQPHSRPRDCIAAFGNTLPRGPQ